jgi:beta-glucosidase
MPNSISFSKIASRLLLVFLAVQTFQSFSQKKAITSPENSKVKQIISSMTLEEKVKMLVGIGFNIPGLPKGILPPSDPADDTIPYKVPGTSGRIHGLSRKGIPVLTLADGPAGVHIWNFGPSDQVKFCTSFPNATLLSSTWDTALIKNVGLAFGNEAKEYGIDILLAPAMNIQRNPLNGRNFEYYSEDPVLSGNISAAMVNGIQEEGEGVSVKHFVANNAETNRTQLNTILSTRALREIYLRGFEITVKKSNPWTIMSSYNRINGTYTSESKDLLTDILRKEWGYKGFVMTDWFGGKDAVQQVNAGNNLLMPGTYAQIKALLSAVKHDSITLKTLDENVEKILNIILLSPTYKKYPYSNKPDLKAHALVSKTAASEGMVLLKNEGNTLPFSASTKLALFGNTSYDLIAGGTGSGDVTRAYTVSLAEGLKNNGIPTDIHLTNAYQQYLNAEKARQPKPSIMTIMNPPPPIKEFIVRDSIYSSLAKTSDIAIFTIGRNAGEGKDRKVENDFELTSAEKASLQKLSSLFHAQNKKLVVVINAGGVIETASWRDLADAILLAWQPGMEGGNAMAEVLSGKVNPSGKLPATFPIVYEDVSSSKNFPGKEIVTNAKRSFNIMDQAVPAEVTYEEGIYVGYRYFNTFKIKPAYAFGYGLSYTTFSYKDLKLSAPDFNGKINASITITNTGKYPGKEIAELYLTAPKGSLDKPSEELKSFGKTRLLQPGESQTLSFALYPKDLASFYTPTNTWVADAGEYLVKIGASSEDIKATKSFRLKQSLLVEKVHNALVPQVKINELKNL